ncbi:MAG: outer membrane beta-barrel protein, partial [Bacteroidota bacterium]|nr:outer membrane beta-barrel protein [Bacteroidota bacterium]
VQGLYVEAGPQLGFLVDSEIEGPNATLGLNEDNFNDIDFAGAVGVGYKFNGGLYLNARYTQGFTDIYDGETGDNATKNGVFAGSVGFIFN